MNRYHLFLIAILVFYTRSSKAQTVHTDQVINFVAYTDDLSRLAFSDEKEIQIRLSSDLSLIGSVPFNPAKVGTVQYLKFDPRNTNLLWIRFGKFTPTDSKSAFFEYPEDSLYCFDYINKTKIAVLPGNAMLAIHGNGKNHIGAINDFIPYVDDYGVPRNAARKGTGVVLIDPKEVPLEHVVRSVTLDTLHNRVLFVNYIDYSDGAFKYQLETRDISSFEIIRTSEIVALIGEEPILSDDGKFILFQSKEYNQIHTQAFSLDELKVVDLAEVTNIAGLLQEHVFLDLKEGKLLARNLSDNTTKWTLWSNLSELFNLNGGILLPDNQLIVYGSTDRLTKNYLYSSGAIQKINLKDLGIYVDIEKTRGTEVKFVPSALRVSDNSSQAEILVNVDGSELLYAQKEGLVEIWSTTSRMKLYEVKLERASKVFPNSNDSTMLIMEEYRKGAGFSDFKLSLLDLKTGISNYRIIREDQEDIDFNYSSFCECVQAKTEANEWICSDDSETLWKINGNSLTIAPIVEFGKNNPDHDKGIASLRSIPGSELVFIILSHGTKPDNVGINTVEVLDSLILFNPKTLSTIRNAFTKEATFPISEKECMVLQGNSLSINAWSSGTVLKKVDLKEWKPKKVNVNQAYAVVFCASEKTGKGRAYRFERLSPFKIDTIELDPSYGFFIPMINQFIGLYDGEITSYSKELDYWGAWNKKKEFVSAKELFQFLGDGKMLLGNSKVIDFGTLEEREATVTSTDEVEVIPLPGYLNAIALKGELTGKIIYVRSVTYVDIGEKPYAQFVIADGRNYQKVYWESEKYTLKSDEYFFPSKIQLSNSGKFAGIVSSSDLFESRGVFIIDLSNKNIYNYPVKTHGGVYFGYDDKYAIVSGSNGAGESNWVEWVVDLSTGKKSVNTQFDKSLLRDTTLLKVEFQHQIVTVSNYVNGEYVKLKDLYAREYLRCAYYSKGTNRILAGSANGTLFVWEKDNSTPLMQLSAGTSQIDDIREEGDHLFVTLESGELIVYRKTDMTELARLIVQKNKNGEYSYAWFTPEGYYKASKEELSNYHFVRNGQAFPLLNFEVYLNRPDYILEQLGYANQSLISAYKEVYTRRLKRYGLEEKGMIDFDHLPTIEITNKEEILQSAVIDSVELKVNIRSTDNIKNVRVQVNGIPISSVESMAIKNQNTNQLSVRVPIGAEKNVITISAVNGSGVESIPDQLTLFGKKPTTAKIVYVGIGVSKYQDSTMNLVFADDDVRRMSRYLKANNSDKADTMTLTNQFATKENIMALKSKLMKTSIDDIVILSFSGHGLLDSLGNFYFANHDINFAQPKSTGISFEQLQFLLDDIPARRKLLLLDACHSGEVDQSNTAIKETTNQGADDGSKGGKVTVTATNLTEQNSFQLMLSNFGDFSTNNGAFVISAAGGEEVAYETEEVGGVFTHSVINALDELSKDYRNNDFSVSELQKLIYSNVQTFGNGRQTPTTRSQNVIWDWNFDLY